MHPVGLHGETHLLLDVEPPRRFIYFRPAEMSRRLPKAGSHNVRPRDAATLIIYDLTGRKPRILMGQRHFTHKFMPGSFVFPGGRVEPQDYVGGEGGCLPVETTTRLLRHLRGVPHPQRALALAHAALRETWEETGIIVGANGEMLRGQCGAPPPDFRGFKFIGRAITPPRRPKRFDARFFAVSAEVVTGETGHMDGEFLAVHWLTLDEAFALDLPIITRSILRDFALRLEDGSLQNGFAPVPFYFMRGACFHRCML